MSRTRVLARAQGTPPMTNDSTATDIGGETDSQAHASAARGRVRLAGLAALTAALLGATAFLAAPFLPAITWATALAVVSWPMHRAIRRRVSRPGLAAASSTGLIAVTILAAGAFVTYRVASEAVDAAAIVKDDALGARGVRQNADRIPLLGRAVAWMERVGLDVEEEIRDAFAPHPGLGADLARNSAAGAVQFLLCLFILYYLFRDSDRFMGAVRALLPLSRRESDFLMARTADSIHATLHATVATSAIDAAAFGLAFWGVGLPAPALWAAIMFVLSVLPVLGAGLVWVPAVVYLAATGRWPGAAVLAALGATTAVYVDNILYARLAGDRMRMHDVPVMIAFLGGLAVFGPSGMVLGPAILSAAEATLEVWKSRVDGMGNSSSPPMGREDPRRRGVPKGTAVMAD